MRTRQEIERDLAAARTQLTAAEAAIVAGGNHTPPAVYFEAAEAQAEVQRLEAELAALPPARPRRPSVLAVLAGGAPPATGAGTPPRRTVVTPPAATTSLPAATVTATTVTRARTPRRNPAAGASAATCQTTQPSSFNWRWLLVPVVLLFVLYGTFLAGQISAVWSIAKHVTPSGSIQLTPPKTVQRQQPPPASARTPVRTPPKAHPPEPQFRSYRDCMFSYGERRELADGRCDHLQ